MCLLLKGINNMRLGISTSLGNMEPKKWAEKMESMGCKSVVFPVDYTADDALINEYVREAAKHDLVIGEVGIWRNAISKDNDERKKNLAYSVGQLRLADRIGAKCCVNVAGAMGPRWDGAYKENYSTEAWKRTVSMIKEVIDAVNPKNTYFALETMPCMFPSSPEEYLRLLHEVSRDRFAVHLDVINMINCPERFFFSEDFVEKCFDMLGDKIVSCHMKDTKLLDDYTFMLRECAIGEGSFALDKYCELINKYNPDMPVIIEHLSNDEEYEKSMKYALERFKHKI